MSSERWWGPAAISIVALAVTGAFVACARKGVRPDPRPSSIADADREPLPVPVVPAGEPRGRLKKEAIRRVVRLHVDDVRYCFDSEVSPRPLLAGVVVVRFIIDAAGNVTGSGLERSTVNAFGVERCIVLAVRRWEFPRPDGPGSVTVSYPFNYISPPLIVLPGQGGANRVTVTAVATDVLVHTTTDSKATPANGMIAVGARGLTLIDTGWSGIPDFLQCGGYQTAIDETAADVDICPPVTK